MKPDTGTPTRRIFLKKAVYHAPLFYALGQLAKPSTVHADATGGPDGPPGDWSPSAVAEGDAPRRADAPQKRETLKF